MVKALPENGLDLKIDSRAIPAKPVNMVAGEAARLILARRFDLVAIKHFTGTAALSKDGPDVLAKGNISAEILQSCAISGEDFPNTLKADFDLRFVPQERFTKMVEEAESGEGVEIEVDDCDIIAFDGPLIDLGEALAQTLGLEIDPYAEGPNADTVREQFQLNVDEPTSPFAALAALKGKKD
jgi:uncharacterized metal-binding protein YceD (DUF177 family)